MADQIQPPRILGRSQIQNQNLLKPTEVKVAEPVDKSPGFYKSIILDAVGIVAAFLAGYSYFKFLEGTWPFLLSISAFLLFIVALALETLTCKKVWGQIGVLTFEIIALFMPFYATDMKIVGISASITFILLLAGYFESRSELEHSTTIRFFKSTHGIVAKTVTAGLLAAIILCLPIARFGSIFIGESMFSGFFSWAAGLANNFYPTITLTGSFNDFAESVAKTGLVNNTTFAEMMPAAQNTVISEATNQVEGNFSKLLGVTASPTSSMSDVVYAAIIKILDGWRSRFSVWFMVGWGVALFLLLRSIGVVVVWIGQFLTMLFYELLLASDFVRIVEQPQTKELIEF
jgi:hypothetical protein